MVKSEFTNVDKSRLSMFFVGIRRFITVLFNKLSFFLFKIEILVKNGKFGQKWKFWSKMEILGKNRIFLST